MPDANNIIDALKQRLGVDSDVDLARKLAVDKRTVSSWRARDSVPDRYQAILKGDDHQTIATPPSKWGEYENVAFRLALFRFARARGPEMQGADYQSLYRLFHSQAGFWFLLRQAQKDLAAALDDKVSVMDTAFALILYEDLQAGDEAILRDRNILDQFNFIPQ